MLTNKSSVTIALPIGTDPSGIVTAIVKFRLTMKSPRANDCSMGSPLVAATYRSTAETDDIGPAMKVLNPRQRAVVHYLLDHGYGADSLHWTEACAAAGYSPDNDGNTGGLRVTATRLRHNPKLGEAIIEEGKRRVTLDLPAFLQTIRIIGRDHTHKDGLKAALAGAAMSGVSPVTVSRNEHVHKHEGGSLMDQIRADCAVLGLDPEEFIRGRMKDITPRPVLIEHDEDAIIHAQLREAGLI